MTAVTAAFFAALAFLFAVASPAAAEDDGLLTLQFENDFIADSDGHFTHGTRIAWMSGEDDIPPWLRAAAERVPLFDAAAGKHIVLSLGQSIFTPDDISIRELIRDDRPYAGWLYGGVGLVSIDGARLDNLELNVGMVGPAAFGEQVQSTWHRWFGFQDPKGWDNQLRNEPGVVLYYDRNWRFWAPFEALGLEGDVTPNAGVALGNVFTHATAGLMARIGPDLPESFGYGPPRIRPSLPGSDYFSHDRGVGWYLFAGVAGRAVARNIFLDGNTFRDSHSVDKHPLIGDFQAGVVVFIGRARLAYTHILRTKEFETQDAPDQFGSLSLSFRF